ncbi:MAG TPA: chlorite dismutase family protein [Dehalococcoidia bacterium]|nr:chlorite dismutase family protein [Dehalococcoidia bacterium]
MSDGRPAHGGNGHGNVEGGRRQVVKFSFYKVAPEWRLLAVAQREEGKRAFARAVDGFANRLQVRSYTTAGTRGDCDFLLWQIGERLEDIQDLATEIMRTPMGPYLSMPRSFLAMTRKSQYVSPKEAEERLHLHPADSKYFFVYPFVKTREWYQLSQDERQEMMNVHIAVGRKYPSVKLNTTYSFGLDDQEFVVSFETDEPADFLDLVMELRAAKSSLYTLRDTPIFTCISMSLRETLDTLGAPGDTVAAPVVGEAASAGPWQKVADEAEVPDGASKAIYFEGEQVALFRQSGRVYAIGNRCSHANASLANGEVVDGAVTCPSHGSAFDLATGEPTCGPANRPVKAYDVRVDEGAIWLAQRSSVSR